jgi:transcriptional regulator with XRE-family HTH domain
MSANSLRRNPVAVAFGVVLKIARNQRGLSQEAFAEEADLSRTMPSLYERGLRAPTLNSLFEIALALDVEPTKLVADTLTQMRGKRS